MGQLSFFSLQLSNLSIVDSYKMVQSICHLRGIYFFRHCFISFGKDILELLNQTVYTPSVVCVRGEGGTPYLWPSTDVRAE